MSRIRKMLLGAVAGVVLALPLALVTQAEAGNRTRPTPHQHQQSRHVSHSNPQHTHANQRAAGRTHTVYIRSSPSTPWRAYGGYSSQQQAIEALNLLRANGYEVFTR